jgi:hypothetical protein
VCVYIYIYNFFLKKLIKKIGHVLRCLLVRVHNLAWVLRSHDNTKKVVQQLPLLSFQQTQWKIWLSLGITYEWGDLGSSQNAEWSFAVCNLYQEVNLNDEPPTCKWPWNLSLGIYLWYYYTLGTTTLPSYSYSYPTTPPPIIMMQWIFLMNIICPAFVQLWTQSL